MTKRMVSPSNRADRPSAEGRSARSADLAAIATRASPEPAGKADRPPRPNVLRRRAQKLDRRPLRDLREGGVRDDDIREILDLVALREREDPGHNEVAGVRGGDDAAEDLSARRDDGLDVAGGAPLGLGAIVLRDRPAQDPDSPVAGPRLLLAEADGGDLRIRVGDPRDGRRVDPHGQAEQRVPDDEAGVVVRDVRELVGPATRAGAVADGVDAAIRGAQPFVDRNAVAVEGDARGLESKAIRRGLATGGDEHVAAFDRPRLVSLPQIHDDAVVAPLDAFNGDAGVELEAVPKEGALEHVGHFLILAR